MQHISLKLTSTEGVDLTLLAFVPRSMSGLQFFQCHFAVAILVAIDQRIPVEDALLS
jgi:hypothetical protein